MIAIRVCLRRHDLLDGTGAARLGGRWNSPGRRVVYASACCGGAMLEILVRQDRKSVLRGHQAGEILIPDDATVERVEPDALPGWEEPNSPAARATGDAWLQDQRSLVLLVPSVPGGPLQRNVLINPLHPDFARVRVGRVADVAWDARLFQR